MKVRALANRLTSRINPNFAGIWRRSDEGYKIAADGTQIPTFTEYSLIFQVQPVSKGLMHVENMNLMGHEKSIYMRNTSANGPVRIDARGGDFIVIGTRTYKVIRQVEEWPDDFTHVIAELQA